MLPLRAVEGSTDECDTPSILPVQSAELVSSPSLCPPEVGIHLVQCIQAYA